MSQFMIKLIFATCLCSSLWIQGSTLSDKVRQKPPDMIENVKESPVLQCSHSISTYNCILWYKQTQDRQLVLLGYLVGSEPQLEPEFKDKFELNGKGNDNGNLTIKNLEFNDAGTYFCAASTGAGNPAYFGKGTKLTVLDPKIKVSEEQDLNVTIIKPSEKESCKKTVTLVCVAKDFYPDHVSITWMVGGKPRTEGVATDPNAFREQETEHFTISSRLKVPRKEWNNEKTEFKCTLKFYDGKDYLYKENKVNGIAGSGYTREDYVKSSQMIKLSYGVFIAKSALYGLVIFVYVWRKGSGK